MYSLNDLNIEWVELHELSAIKNYIQYGVSSETRVINRFQNAECNRLISMLRSCGIPCMSLFNENMYNILFGVNYLLPINAINILVEKKNLQASYSLLLNNGYQSVYYDENSKSYLKYDRKTYMDVLINQYKFVPLIYLSGNRITYRVYLWFKIDWGHGTIKDAELDRFIQCKEFADKSFIMLCVMNYRKLNTICKLLEYNCIPVLPFIETKLALLSGNINIDKVFELCSSYSCYLPVFYMMAYNNILYNDNVLLPHFDEYKEFLERYSIVKNNSYNWNCSFEERLYTDNIFPIVVKQLKDVDKVRVGRAKPQLSNLL